MSITHTERGFDAGCAKVTIRPVKKTVVIAIDTPKKTLVVRITPTGIVKTYLRKAGTI